MTFLKNLRVSKNVSRLLLNVLLSGSCLAASEPGGFSNAARNASQQTPDSIARKDKWFRDAKLGAFIHFGVSAQLEGEYKGRGEWKYSEWIQVTAQIPSKEYHEVAAAFNPVDFDADEWVKTFKDCGMKYVVFTAKHHDGFALFNSQVSEYDILDHTSFKRDIVQELSEACGRHGLKFGVYYSHAQDWDEPDAPFLRPADAQLRSVIHPDLPEDFKPDTDRYIQNKSLPQVEELMTNYKIDLVWFDTPAGITESAARRFSEVVRKHNPDCLINSRLIRGYQKNPQLLELYDYESLGDKKIPNKDNPLYTESPDSVASSYGYKSKGNVTYHTEEEIIHRFVHTVCAGGNYLLNIGSMANGKLDPKGVKLYRALGDLSLRSGGDHFAFFGLDEVSGQLSPYSFCACASRAIISATFRACSGLSERSIISRGSAWRSKSWVLLICG